MKAFVFINVTPGESTRVTGEIRKIEGVELAEPCSGLPNIIALVEVASLQGLQNFLLKEVQQISGVMETDAHVCLRGMVPPGIRRHAA